MAMRWVVRVTTHSPLRVLIVEHEALLAMELEELLIEAGHEVVGWATSADEAMVLAKIKQPDLAFIDLQLKDGDSLFALAAQIRAISNVVVVFITANAGVLPECYGGAVGVIAKPYSADSIRAVFRYLHEGLRKTRPLSVQPTSLSLSPRYRETWGGVP